MATFTKVTPDELRRNLFSNPRGTSTSSTYWGTAGAGAYSLRTDMTGDVTTAVRWTASSTTSGAISMVGGSSTPSSASITFKARVRSSYAGSVAVYARPAVGSSSNQVLLGNVALSVGVTEIELTAASFTVSASSTAGVVVLPGTVVVGATLDFTKVLIAAADGAYFDGAFTDDDGEYAWVGTTDLSQSTYSSVRNEPLYIFGPFAAEREVRNTARELLHSSTVRGNLIPTANRSGEFLCRYTSHANAVAGQTFFAAPTLFVYDGPDTSFDTRFVVFGGSLSIRQVTALDAWDLTVPYKEIPS